MPCGNPNHEHPAWPQQGQHELLIEACENHCGWCEYKTKSANNLRVHAKRHVANKRETRLRRITIFKGKAGRKRVQMARPRFPAPKAREENKVRLGDPIQGHESDYNNNMEHEMSGPSFPSQSDYSRQGFLSQIPSVTPARSPSIDRWSIEANIPEDNLPWDGLERSNTPSRSPSPWFPPSSENTRVIQALKRRAEHNPGCNLTSTRGKIDARLRRNSVEWENLARETFKRLEQDTYEIYHESDDVFPNSSERSWPTQYSKFQRPLKRSQVSHQRFPSSPAQAQSTELRDSGSVSSDQPSLQAVDYSRGDQTSPNLLCASFPSVSNNSEFQITNKNQSQSARLFEPSYHPIRILHKEIKAYLLKKPHLEEFKLLVQDSFEFNGFGLTSAYDIDCVKDLEIDLTTKALEIAKSDLSYLSFCSALLRCLREASFSFTKGDRNHLYGPLHRESYFAKALVRICNDVEYMGKSATYSSSPKDFICNHIVCLYSFREPGPKLPKQYYWVHLQDYHNEDVGCTEERDLVKRSIHFSHWYCSTCLSKNLTHKGLPQRWSCWLCGLDLEGNRVKARQKLRPIDETVDVALDVILPSPLSRASPL